MTHDTIVALLVGIAIGMLVMAYLYEEYVVDHDIKTDKFQRDNETLRNWHEKTSQD